MVIGTESIKSVLLVGVTGHYSFGQYVTQELVDQKDHFRRLGVYHDLSRPVTPGKMATLDRLSDEGFEIIRGNGFESSEPFQGFDCIMSFLGNHGLYLQPSLIDAAVAAGVRHIYPSEYGADLLVGDNWTQRYYVDKVKTRKHLESVGEQFPDLGWTYFLVGRLTEWSILAHFGFDNRSATAKLYGVPEGRQSLISARDASAYLVETLKEPLQATAAGKRRTYRVSGSSPTYSEVLATLELVTGRHYDVQYLNVEDARAEEQAAQESGDIEAELSASHKLIQGRQGTLLPEPWDNACFPNISPSTLEDSLRAALSSAKFRKAYGID